VKKPLEIMDWIQTMLYTFNAVHLPFYPFPSYRDYNDPELANIFKAALPHVVELLVLFTTQLWLIPTQALLPRTTTVDFGNCSQQSQGSDQSSHATPTVGSVKTSPMPNDVGIRLVERMNEDEHS
jgi:hypothetical protein